MAEEVYRVKIAIAVGTRENEHVYDYNLPVVSERYGRIDIVRALRFCIRSAQADLRERKIKGRSKPVAIESLIWIEMKQ